MREPPAVIDRTAEFATMHAHLTRRFAEDRAARNTEFQRMAESIAQWRDIWRTKHLEFFGVDRTEKLKELRSRLRQPDMRRPEMRRKRRERSLTLMRELEIDVDALHELRVEAYEQLAAIRARTPARFGTLKTTIDRSRVNYAPFRASFDPSVLFVDAPVTHIEPGPHTFTAPYLWWDRTNQINITGKGRAIRRDSYLSGPAGRTGSCIYARNHDADDGDTTDMLRESGMLVAYTPVTRSRLQIDVQFVCSYDAHTINTDDEWGWSEYEASTREESVIGVMHGVSDIGGEHRDVNFVAGLHGAGDGESSPGSRIVVPTGEVRNQTLTTDEIFDASVPLLVYAGTAQIIQGNLNDVSMDISVDSSWIVQSINVTEV